MRHAVDTLFMTSPFRKLRCSMAREEKGSHLRNESRRYEISRTLQTLYRQLSATYASRCIYPRRLKTRRSQSFISYIKIGAVNSRHRPHHRAQPDRQDSPVVTS